MATIEIAHFYNKTSSLNLSYLSDHYYQIIRKKNKHIERDTIDRDR